MYMYLDKRRYLYAMSTVLNRRCFSFCAPKLRLKFKSSEVPQRSDSKTITELITKAAIDRSCSLYPLILC